jgi:hypothetical protein
MAPSVARESTLHCKLDSQLHGAAVRSIFWVGGKWIMEIPVHPVCKFRVQTCVVGACSLRAGSCFASDASLLTARRANG